MTTNIAIPLANSNPHHLDKTLKSQNELDDFSLKFHKGNTYLMLGEYSKAASIFFYLLDHYASNWELVHAIAITMLKLNDFTRAMTYFSILHEEYQDKCDVHDFLTFLADQSEEFPADHRFFILEQEHCVNC